MTNSRWKAAVHESGHAISAIRLGGRCSGIAIFYDDAGAAYLDDLDATRMAFATGAGPAAEYLANENAAPETAYVSRKPLPDDDVESHKLFAKNPSLSLRLSQTSEIREKSDGPSDSRILALWAVTGHEDTPDTWARRVSLARSVARDIVEKNAAEILHIARRLYAAGSLSENEILTLLNGGNT